jgi:hypothetical protein
MIKNIVKILLNVKIYPTNEQFRQTTEEYLSENHQDFFKKFKKRDKWISYYETIFYPQVSLNKLSNNLLKLLKLFKLILLLYE